MIRWQQQEIDRFIDEHVEPVVIGKLQRIGAIVRRLVVKKLSIPFRQGNETTRHKPTRQGTPSRAGEPPRTDLGTLRQSIFMNVIEDEWAVEIGPSVMYGIWLETGTRKMAARPFLRPSLDESQGEIQRIIG